MPPFDIHGDAETLGNTAACEYILDWPLGEARPTGEEERMGRGGWYLFEVVCDGDGRKVWPVPREEREGADKPLARGQVEAGRRFIEE